MVQIDRLLFVNVLFAVLYWHSRCSCHFFLSLNLHTVLLWVFFFFHTTKHFHRWNSMKLSRLIMFDFALFSKHFSALCQVKISIRLCLQSIDQCYQMPCTSHIAYQGRINWFHFFYSHVKNWASTIHFDMVLIERLYYYINEIVMSQMLFRVNFSFLTWFISFLNSSSDIFLLYYTHI